MGWLVADIGCIECGEPSSFRLFAEREEAVAHLAAARAEQKEHWSGQHSFELYEVAADGTTTYTEVDP